MDGIARMPGGKVVVGLAADAEFSETLELRQLDMSVVQKMHYYLWKGEIDLLQIKDSDIRIMILNQARDAVDKGVHIGGAFSAVVPMVALFYGGVIDLDVVNPTRIGQDMFVLSKGHAVATMAAIYADVGYFDRSVLVNSRSRESILNGHPGPILPGVQISTGPLGQGLSVAEGFALVGNKRNPTFDVFCVTGDGELQEGPIWEAVMLSSVKRVDNLCVIVDANCGQLDDTQRLLCPLPNLDGRFASFGWRVFDVDGTQYGPVLDALRAFKYGHRDGRPTVIIARTQKGGGGFSDFMMGHKVTIADEMTAQELALQEQARSDRIGDLSDLLAKLDRSKGGAHVRERLLTMAKDMNLEIVPNGNGCQMRVDPIIVPPKTQPATPRDKRIVCDPLQLPKLEQSKAYGANEVITAAMKVYARDRRVVSIDADLAGLSGLHAGVRYVDRGRAFNVGVAEANMMCIAEAYAVMGFNVWVSTFGPFFDWKVLRRIAIGQQERLEAMATKGAWLSEGYGLDITFVATSSDIETRTNGATHMGNDDALVFDNIAHLKIINISCPRQLLSVIRWIMDGNRGLVYLRIPRTPSPVLYQEDLIFEFGKGLVLRKSPDDQAVIVSNGRAVHEALAAAEELNQSGIMVGVVDMPSMDEELAAKLYDSGKPIFIIEQNNGYLWRHYQAALFKHTETINTGRIVALNTLDKDGQPQFIHSGTYPELVEQFGLSAPRLAAGIRESL